MALHSIFLSSMVLYLASRQEQAQSMKYGCVQLQKSCGNSWEVLTEAMQTIFRKHLIKDGYELMKELSRGKKINKEDLHHLIDKIDIPSEERQALKSLTPSSYTGIAKTLAKQLKYS